jgi:hypothetical protein
MKYFPTGADSGDDAAAARRLRPPRRVLLHPVRLGVAAQVEFASKLWKPVYSLDRLTRVGETRRLSS